MKLVFALVAIGILSCYPEKKKGEKANEKVNSDGSKLVTSKHSNGKIRAEITYKDGKRSGMSRSYDINGNLVLELPYVDDKREGISKKYYAGGKQLSQTTEYRGDKMHGKQTKYRENGDLMSEALYENDFPCLGLKQYLTDNTLKREYPTIRITPIDQLETQGLYVLEISMSEKVRAVKYYSGKLSPSGCLTGDLYFIMQNESKKTGQLRYHLSPGGFLMEELNIIAAVTTLQGNIYITQRSYNLAIDN
jgi:antitoxin component YwqK of YwqJK toxin-antitoxin module